jgi:hypothetical protein
VTAAQYDIFLTHLQSIDNSLWYVMVWTGLSFIMKW